MNRKYLFIFLMMSTCLGWSQVKKVNPITSPPKYNPLDIRVNEEALNYTFKKISIQQKKWYSYNKVTLNLSEVAFSNWKAGGNNSISALANGRFKVRYATKRFFWDNELNFSYGINAQKGQILRKTDDQIDFSSTFGYRGRSKSYWYYSSKFSISTQISDGYNYPNQDKPISKFMAPGYVILGIGAEYAPNSMNFNLFISPLSLKTTLVLDQNLANKGAFGVDPGIYDKNNHLIRKGRKTNTELGFLISESWKTKIFTGIEMTNRLNLYGDYLNDFGNIDIDWEISLDMKVNSYVQARLGTHIKYDDDVHFLEGIDGNGNKYSYGPRTQLKQILGIGVTYTF